MPSAPFKPIRNIIFDLGVVILNIDYELTSKAFRELGIINFDEIYSKARQQDLFDLLETGKISPTDFRNNIRTFLPPSTTDQKIDDAWNAMLLNLPEETFNALSVIRNQYKTFLLSNTNEIHINAFSVIIEQQYGMDRFNRLFDRIYYSSEVGIRKPNREIFEMVLHQNQLDPSETLFIDDSPQHVEGALKTGIQAILLKKDQQVTDLLKELNLL